MTRERNWPPTIVIIWRALFLAFLIFFVWKNAVYRCESWYVPLTESDGADVRYQKMTKNKEFQMIGWPLIYKLYHRHEKNDVLFSPMGLLVNFLAGMIILGILILVRIGVCKVNLGGEKVKGPGGPDN